VATCQGISETIFTDSALQRSLSRRILRSLCARIEQARAAQLGNVFCAGNAFNQVRFNFCATGRLSDIIAATMVLRGRAFIGGAP
jgi:hypothetical protein